MLSKVVGLLALACVAGRDMMAQSSSCLGPNDTASSFVERIKQQLRAPANADTVRNAASTVSLVTSTATCDSAVAAYNQAHSLTGGNAVSALYVAKFPGREYIVWRPGKSDQDWFGLDWTYKISVR